MRQHYVIKCYVSKEELEKIKQIAKEKGFSSLSCYLRVVGMGVNTKDSSIRKINL